MAILARRLVIEISFCFSHLCEINDLLVVVNIWYYSYFSSSKYVVLQLFYNSKYYSYLNYSIYGTIVILIIVFMRYNYFNYSVCHSFKINYKT